MLTIQSVALTTKSLEVEYPGIEGFNVTLNYLSRSLSSQLLESSKNSKINTSTGKREEVLDQDVFSAKFSEAAVKGWTGLTYAGLASIILIDEASIADMKEEVEYSKENAAFLIKNSQAFDSFVNDNIYELSNFR